MMSKCANPACSRPFHYFRSGKIYLIDAAASNGTFRPSNGSRGMEYFWLCGECSRSMRVALDGFGAVKVERVSASTPITVAKLRVQNLTDKSRDTADVGSQRLQVNL